MFLIAVAAHISAPEPTNYRAWFGVNDFPTYLPEEGVWYVGTRTIVRPDGTVQSCEVEYPSKYPKLDVLTCSIILKRAKYHPAGGADGSPIYGADRTTIIWSLDVPPEIPADATFEVKSLPGGRSRSAYVPITFLSSPSGAITSCEADRRRPPAADPTEYNFDPALVATACQHIGASFSFRPVKNDAGTSVSAVQNAIVLFKVTK